MAHPLLAQTDLGTVINGVGPLGQVTSLTTALMGTETVVSMTLGLLTVIGGLYFMFQLIIAGYGYISAGGDKALVQTAQKKLTNNFLGLTVVVLSYLIAGIVGRLVGLDIMRLSFLLMGIHP
ncbi:hypothetical protein A2397_03820 [Candidatus Amesbacteria bacterium RIFOXYB1_FULL_44_23]|uniref:Uncharacterized protein n=1 Tax=Candidatus Amesbacteria bacterium RIFOXYB1_FULL_44_23 TaxID=1797263 RepID=A0A1F4ZXK1_9BACT|nr:MAG: hypothetical protein A2397_03820 [Candidatus Amesbacteria bacterium RIFOXYB1_FULL_44_23]